MGRNRSFAMRAREEVERIQAEEAAKEERKQARMRELAEQARERRSTTGKILVVKAGDYVLFEVEPP
jgi:hypothetical protein